MLRCRPAAPEVGVTGDPAQVGVALAREGEHAGRRVDAHDVEAAGREVGGRVAGAAADVDDRARQPGGDHVVGEDRQCVALGARPVAVGERLVVELGQRVVARLRFHAVHRGRGAGGENSVS